MTTDQQNTAIAFLLALALESGVTMDQAQQIAKKLLGQLDPDEVSVAAGTQIDFGEWLTS